MAHGITVSEVNDGNAPVNVIGTSAIGLIGTAPGASGISAGDLVVVRGAADIAALGLDDVDPGTIGPALEEIFKQARATVVVHCIAEGVDDAATQTNIAGAAASNTGVWRFVLAQAELGIKPKILIAPEHSGAAAVYAELIAVADRLLAVAIFDGPDTDEAAAVALAGSISDTDGRGYLVDPWLYFGDATARPPSPAAAGDLASCQYWESPSNRVLAGVTGTTRAIEFEHGVASTEAQALNDANVATVIRQGGWRLWGVRGLGTNPQTLQLNQRRVADTINESIKAAHQWAVDRGITRNLVDAVVDTVNVFLRQETARGAIAGGVCWPNEELNTPTSLAAGKLYIDYDFTPTPVAEDLQFTQHITNTYLSSILG